MPVDSVTRRQLERYLDELYLWAPRLNLTTVPRGLAWARHIEDSLVLAEVAGLRPGQRVCDLGSGAGLPGLPLAITHPDVSVVLCDSDQRRCAFLTHTSGLLELANVSVITGRAEQLGHTPGRRESFDVVVSRALAAPAVLCELSLPLLRIGGRMCALVGDAALAPAQARAAAAACGGGPPTTPAPGILLVAKVSATPDRYPRRAGVPARRPLT